MRVEFELFQLITVIGLFLGAMFGLSKLHLRQLYNGLDKRFQAQEQLRGEASARWDERFGELKSARATEADHWQRVERDLFKLRAELPKEYVRREDHIRFETVINAKLDALNTRFDLLIEQGKRV